MSSVRNDIFVKESVNFSKPRKRDLSTIGAACKGAQWQMHTHKSM